MIKSKHNNPLILAKADNVSHTHPDAAKTLEKLAKHGSCHDCDKAYPIEHLQQIA